MNSLYNLNREENAPKILEHDKTEYTYSYLLTNNVSSLYAYPVINHGDEWYRSASCIPYDGTPFTIENDVVKTSSSDPTGVLLRYLTGDQFCSVYCYNKNGWGSSHDRIVFFKDFALDCIINRFPEAIGAFTIITKEIGGGKREFSFTYIITNKASVSQYTPSFFAMDSYAKSNSENLINLRRTDILLFMLSECFGYSIEKMSSISFEWNCFQNLENLHPRQYDTLNYLYPRNYPSKRPLKELFYTEFISNAVCVANVKVYNYGLYADSVDKNINRVLNYIIDFPDFITDLPPKHYSHVSRALYFAATHFNDKKINEYIFAFAYYLLSKAAEHTNLPYFIFLRCDLINERLEAAHSAARKIFPTDSSNSIENVVDYCLLADYLLIKLHDLPFFRNSDDITIRCEALLNRKFMAGTDYKYIYDLLSVEQSSFISKLNLSVNKGEFVVQK
ncbi:hypothetical protein M2480_001294 [Parabacteroides sp. PFB2-12]|uniref:hypothetical protein n=1 Tax=unclassified Parabacteroides TaxID=2649774 RepID=UPI002473C989|nr:MULTISPECIES: hypothetical protein [unclassified Parabacteroides]MDH6343305.1 hypothetical protein [Parabacteroides sp. PM6-13]MDH6390321.1 hypothetical protein [Parabacteroides sp. PFB2-12]